MNARQPARSGARWTAHKPAHTAARAPAHAIILADRERLPWRFFGRLTTAILAGLSTGR